jgi:hypothetical protein
MYNTGPITGQSRTWKERTFVVTELADSEIGVDFVKDYCSLWCDIPPKRLNIYRTV